MLFTISEEDQRIEVLIVIHQARNVEYISQRLKLG
jgi:hypothetical protein